MVQEINMTPEQAISFILALVFLIWKLWHFKRPEASPEPCRATETTQAVESTAQQLNPEYGAYIQLAGRKFN